MVSSWSQGTRAARARLDEQRWQMLRGDLAADAIVAQYDGLTPVDRILTPDQVAALDRGLRPVVAP